MKESPRLLAVKILNEVETRRAFAEPLLDETLSLNPFPCLLDRRLLTHIVYGTLRMRGFLDWTIQHVSHRRIARMDVSTRNILRTAFYQLQYMERIPEFAIVDEAVKISKELHPAASGLVNAVLRTFIREKDRIPYPDVQKDPVRYISIVHSHPLWLVKRWFNRFGFEETKKLCLANNEIPPLTLRVNRLKTCREKVKDELLRAGFVVQETSYSPDGLSVFRTPIPLRDLNLYREGHIYVQDEASQLISYLVNPEAGSLILDLCAGRGGKTTHLAEIMQNQGSILAIDIRGEKLAALRDTTGRMGIQIIRTRVADAMEDLGEEIHGIFDCVLLDAPCSGTGTLRRNPEIKWFLSPADIQTNAMRQKKLLHMASRYPKRGGHIVYSTCTIEPEENQEVVEDFLGSHGNFTCVPAINTLHSHFSDARGFFELYPHRHGTDGFFAAVMRRV